MRQFTRRTRDIVIVDDQLTLPFDLRKRSRFRSQLDSGGEAGVVLPRGTVLRHGDLVVDEAGVGARVIAAPERVSTVRGPTPTALARACYHLGNRHVPLQIGAGFARYQHDHVLDDMVRELGLTVAVETAPFEPEAGAYGGGAAHHHDRGERDDAELP